MTVGALMEALRFCNKDAVVRLHHKEGEVLLFAVGFLNDDKIVVFETESDNDMAEEIQTRFDEAVKNGEDELDVYMKMLKIGIDVEMVGKYMGSEVAAHMKEFCEEHGLI